jgi:hypothetical protein
MVAAFRIAGRELRIDFGVGKAGGRYLDFQVGDGPSERSGAGSWVEHAADQPTNRFAVASVAAASGSTGMVTSTVLSMVDLLSRGIARAVRAVKQKAPKRVFV